MMVTALLLVCGAMTMTWICDTISESGFGTILVILFLFLFIVFLFCLACFKLFGIFQVKVHL